MEGIRRDRRRVGLMLALGAGLISGLGLSACSNEAARSTAATPSLTVRVVRVEPRPLEETLEVTGSLVSSVAVDVKTQFAGRLVTLLKQEGDRVQKGELLAGLEETDARLALGQARATLDVAQATLDRARVAEEHARRELERAQNLLRSGGITDRDFQAAEMTARDTQAQVKLAEAQVEQARQAVAVAQKHLSDCRIVSPINGEVERKSYNPGGWVDGNALLYKLVDNSRLELETYVASSEIARLTEREKIRFSVAAFPEEEFTASVLTVSPAVQLLNRSVAVRAAVPNPDGKLKAGMFVKGRIILGVKPAAVVVPLEAVWRRVGQAPFVYVVEQNRARRREVKLGLEQPQSIEIAAGLKAGEVVVAEQNLELADGASVTARP
jgi:membrane fusion protein (multidrug efflux system)